MKATVPVQDPDILQQLGVLSGTHGIFSSTAQKPTMPQVSAENNRLSESPQKTEGKAESSKRTKSMAKRSEETPATHRLASPDTTLVKARSGRTGRAVLSSDAPERLAGEAVAHPAALVASPDQPDLSTNLLCVGNALSTCNSEKELSLDRGKQRCGSSALAKGGNAGLATPFFAQSRCEPLSYSPIPTLGNEPSPVYPPSPSSATGSFTRAFSTFSRVDRRDANSAFTYQMTFLLLVIVSSVVLLHSTPRKRYAALNVSQWAILTEFSGVVDTGVDPCGSFYRYACGRASRGSDSALSLSGMFQPWWIRVGSLYWPSGTSAGTFLRDYFQACVDASMDVETRGAETARALVEIVKPRVNMAWSRYLLLLMEMNLKYSVQAVVAFSVLGSGPWPDAVVPLTPKVRVEDPLAVLLVPVHRALDTKMRHVYDRIRGDALNALNEALSTNVTSMDVDRLVEDLDSASTEPPLGGVGDMDVLGMVVPAMQPSKWRLYLEGIIERPFSGNVYHAPVRALKRRFSILLDEERLPQVIVFTLLEGTTYLLIDMLLQRPTESVHHYFAVCQKLAFRFEAVAVLSAIQQRTRTAQHDFALGAVFQSVAAAVTSQVSRSFPSSTDAPRAVSRLRELRLLLPSEVVPLDTPLPTLGASYARNYLLAETFDLSLNRFKPAKEDLGASAVTALLASRPSVIGTHVILPVALYAALDLASHTDVVVPMSVVGVDLADALWSFVFRGSWGRETTSMLSEYYRCRDSHRGLSTLRFQHPVLSLGTALSTTRGASWNDKFTVGELSIETSRSEVFYTLFVMHHYCLSPRKTRAALAAEVDYLTGTSVDFARAFGCLLPENVTACTLPGLT
ncbi:hypothetical protein HPB50_022387 [Hyalomma asiaticum]|uniref:Uncharacterized protein n=1 Tax=Hyalomma asiaticum TaxID=266040 RepID=A0ACB7S316_HYAAI|nr:hypothetical protein HPB50_022387 [Hyalomma asiaticum]